MTFTANYGDLCSPVFDLATTLSKFLHLGLTVDQVSGGPPQTQPTHSGSQGTGTLREGAEADIAVFSLSEGSFEFVDALKQKRLGQRKLIPVATVKAEESMFCIDPGRGLVGSQEILQKILRRRLFGEAALHGLLATAAIAMGVRHSTFTSLRKRQAPSQPEQRGRQRPRELAIANVIRVLCARAPFTGWFPNPARSDIFVIPQV